MLICVNNVVDLQFWLRQYFLDKLKFILQLCGYDPTLYNGHSFRSPAATSAGKALVEDHMIKILGR
jgi:hypothetical protein